MTDVTAVHIVEHAALPLVKRPAQAQTEGAAVVHLLVFGVKKNKWGGFVTNGIGNRAGNLGDRTVLILGI